MVNSASSLLFSKEVTSESDETPNMVHLSQGTLTKTNERISLTRQLAPNFHYITTYPSLPLPPFNGNPSPGSTSVDTILNPPSPVVPSSTSNRKDSDTKFHFEDDSLSSKSSFSNKKKNQRKKRNLSNTLSQTEYIIQIDLNECCSSELKSSVNKTECQCKPKSIAAKIKSDANIKLSDAILWIPFSSFVFCLLYFF